MSKVAPISLCLIVRDEVSQLKRCLDSVSKYVKEIVIVDTGSTDGTKDLAEKLADRFEVFTKCNDPEIDKIDDFSMARNRSFELATQPWIMWIDADDEVVGAEHLPDLIERLDTSRAPGAPACVMLPYEYTHDEAGNCTCLHYRERIVTNTSGFRWINPIHEVISVPDGTVSEIREDIRIIHRRSQSVKPFDSERNFRIIKKLIDSSESPDPRHLYYLGLEYGNLNRHEDAVAALEKYVSMTGWDDEKCLACLKISEHMVILGRLEDAISWALKALAVQEMWSEPYFALAKYYYFLAQRGGPQEFRNWTRSVNFARLGLQLPPTRTVLFINPLDREYTVHVFLNFALNKIGDVDGALRSVEIALEKKPNDPMLLNNLRCYREWIAKRTIDEAVDQLTVIKALEESQRDIVKDIIRNRTSLTSNGTVWSRHDRTAAYPRDITVESFPKALVSPGSSVWGIPDSCVWDDLPVDMNKQQLLAVVDLVWKEYIRNDEIVAAENFLLNAPFFVRDSDEVQRRLMITRRMYEWMSDVAKTQLYNTPLDQSGVPLVDELLSSSNPLTGAVGSRFRWLSRYLEPSDRILDMGCLDGTMTNRWSREGYDVTGVDLSENSIRVATEVAKREGLSAKYICAKFSELAFPPFAPESYDVVTSGDVYEHLTDPVRDLLDPAWIALREGGRMSMTTPYGSWIRGRFIPTAHPWLWCREDGDAWNSPDRHRSHLIAPSVWSVKADFDRSEGWWIRDCHVVFSDMQDVPEQGNVCVYAIKTVSRPQDLLDIVFFIGDGLEDWTPESVKRTGIGGSELAAIQVAKLLAAKGHRVRVYSSCGEHGEGIYDHVEYLRTEKFHDLDCDVLVVSRFAEGLSENFCVDAKARFLWVHDVIPKGMTHELSLKADKIFALSEWHKSFILQHHPFVNPDQIYVTRNGLDMSRFWRLDTKRNPHRVVYSSSPDRGLFALLQMWPRIRERVPDAELRIFYGFLNWEKCVQGNEQQLALIRQLRSMIESLADQGVSYFDRVSQDRLAEEFLGAGAWLYPTWFSETSCITAMEAQAAGLAIVSSPIAALTETVSNRGRLIPGDWLSAEYQKKFVEAAVGVLLNTTQDERRALVSYAEKNFTWSGVADDWERLFKETIGKPSVVPYVRFSGGVR